MQYQDGFIRGTLQYKDSRLMLSGINLDSIASEYGTPVFVYDEKQIKKNAEMYLDAFTDIESIICYAVKANYNGNILRMLASLGLGADVVSGGELKMALAAGIDPSKIVFAGVGKSPDEIRFALEQNILMINIESEQEFEEVQRIAKESGITANIALRINPNIDPKTHPKIATGLKTTKFGIEISRALEIYKKAASNDMLNIKRVHLHIGSQVTEITPFELAAESAAGFCDLLKKEGIVLEYVDIGGGLGIGYENPRELMPSDIAAIVKKHFEGRPERIIIEPGRSIVGDAGYLVTKINYIKTTSEKNFVVIDAGFNDLVRPTMYGAYHEILPLMMSESEMIADVVGPVCESGDFIAKDRRIIGAEKGAKLAICDSGAYGFSMASNYNSRLRPAEVLISENGTRLIRNRETFDDLIKSEVI